MVSRNECHRSDEDTTCCKREDLLDSETMDSDRNGTSRGSRNFVCICRAERGRLCGHSRSNSGNRARSAVGQAMASRNEPTPLGKPSILSLPPLPMSTHPPTLSLVDRGTIRLPPVLARLVGPWLVSLSMPTHLQRPPNASQPDDRGGARCGDAMDAMSSSPREVPAGGRHSKRVGRERKKRRRDDSQSS